MTELEMMQRAKMYMDKLAQGIDPLTDRELPDDTLLNNVRLARCFFFTSEILRRVTENGGEVAQPVKKMKRTGFTLSEEQRQAVQISETPVKISEFVEMLNAVIDTEKTKKISTTAITNWLLRKGFLSEVSAANGKKSRLPSEQGMEIGLSTEDRTTIYGVMKVVLYNADAQNFILDHLDAITGHADMEDAE